jgi:hypothetical protein
MPMLCYAKGKLTFTQERTAQTPPRVPHSPKGRSTGESQSQARSQSAISGKE